MKPASPNRVHEVPDLIFPDPETPLKEHRQAVSWSQWMDEREDALRFHLAHHDSPESRLATKIHKRFVL